ncbi:hypothetical protein FRC07_015154 [Ceratobasidium sp. 392]|nr:hypothetical protein FRC07_015154 [Ceratobasidium sp. 392]
MGFLGGVPTHDNTHARGHLGGPTQRLTANEKRMLLEQLIKRNPDEKTTCSSESVNPKKRPNEEKQKEERARRPRLDSDNK